MAAAASHRCAHMVGGGLGGPTRLQGPLRAPAAARSPRRGPLARPGAGSSIWGLSPLPDGRPAAAAACGAASAGAAARLSGGRGVSARRHVTRPAASAAAAVPPPPSPGPSGSGSASGGDSAPSILDGGLARPPRELQRLINGIPYRKIALWAAVAAFLWPLHDFFGIAMGTFIVSFIGQSFIASAIGTQPLRWLSKDLRKQRRILVAAFFTIILAAITLFGVLTIPDIAREGADFVNRLKSDNVWVVLVTKMRTGLGDQVMEAVERAVLLTTANDITRAAVDHGHEWTAQRSVQLGLAVSGMLKGYTTTAASIITVLLKSVTRFTIQVLVSLILGFFMLWDLPKISRGVSSLKQSRLAPIYDEVAPVLSVFGRLFGKALQAQSRIAMVNTALTALGMWALAIPGVGLLSLFTFICSFIPIAGVVISTTPIAFVALTEYGFIKLGLVILMVIGVHFVEAYALNPAIYSAHLKLHPLLVMCALVVAEHSLGVWGLLLAVPLTVFALDYLIRYPESSVTEVGVKELEKMRTEDESLGLEQPYWRLADD